jgi:hypothetical protein
VKKLFVLILLVLVIFVVYNRQRIYVRDPLGSVMRDGVKEAGVEVYINFSNEVLLKHDAVPVYATLINHDQPVGTPKKLTCLMWLACMTDQYPAMLVALDGDAEIEAMSGKAVAFKDHGNATVVTLR